jgi:LysR family transcriptional activator of nhaA
MYRLGVETLNHHHLLHFWTVVREGGVTRASEKLNVSQPTVSGQLRELQEALGEKLLVRHGRSVVLTDVGRTVYRYADEIFALGRELQQAVKGRVTHPARLAVAYSHLLGECGVSVFATEGLAASCRRRFPRSLHGAPFLLPSGDSGLRLSLEDWSRTQGIRPRVVGMFEDSALIDAFGEAGPARPAAPGCQAGRDRA